MSVFTIVEGKVVVKPESVDATATLSNVDTAGATIALDVKNNSGKMLNILVLQKTGPSTAFTIKVFDDVSKAEENNILEISSDTPTARINLNKLDVPFHNGNDNNLYVEIIPNTGNNHSFFIRTHINTSKSL